jgi:putative aldouronate transport system permease protein
VGRTVTARGARSRSRLGETLTYVSRNRWLYILLVPGTAFLIVFRYVPMYGVIIAFKDFSVVRGIWKSPWVGFSNFVYLFTSSGFYEIFRNSVLISLYRLVFAFPVPILMAILLSEMRSVAFKKTVQTIIYLPHFISWVVIAAMVYNFLSPSTGIVNKAIVALGGKPRAFLQEPRSFRGIIVLSDVWKESGWGTIIYLAAILGIDPELYEAAVIDGANRFQRILRITMPGIVATIIVILILRMGSILRNGFEQIFLLYSPLVYEVADVFETYTYRVGIREGRFSFATAVGLFQSLIGLVLILSTNALARKYGESSLW